MTSPNGEFDGLGISRAAGMTLTSLRASMVDVVSDAPREEIQADIDWSDEGSYTSNTIVSLTVLDDRDNAPTYSAFFFDLLCDQSLGVQFALDEFRAKGQELIHLLVEGLVRRARHELLHLKYMGDQNFRGDPPYWSATLKLADLGQTVGDVLELRETCRRVVTLPIATQSTRGNRELIIDWDIAKDLVLAGFPELLIGQKESTWLEVKSQAYSFDAAGEIELAQDIARFANGDNPGLLIMGYRTKSRPGYEVVDKVVPVNVKDGAATIYHKTIDRLVYPPVRGLRVERVPFKNQQIIVVVVPEQREEDKPFLVTGAIVGDKCEGAFISIVRRRGEHSIPISPEAIHAALSAGRAALRKLGQ